MLRCIKLFQLPCFIANRLHVQVWSHEAAEGHDETDRRGRLEEDSKHPCLSHAELARIMDAEPAGDASCEQVFSRVGIPRPEMGPVWVLGRN